MTANVPSPCTADQFIKKNFIKYLIKLNPNIRTRYKILQYPNIRCHHYKMILYNVIKNVGNNDYFL